MRYAIITHLDTVFFDSSDLKEILKIYDLWGSDFFRGIYDYETSCYLDEVDIIDRLGVSICSID